MELTTFSFGLIVLYLIWRVLSPKRHNLLPGPGNGLPIFGKLLSVDPQTPHLTLTKWAKEFGDIFTVRMGNNQWVVINEHNLLRETFNNDPVLHGRPHEEAFAAFSGGRYGVVFTDGDDWKAQRRFTLRHLRDFGFGKVSMAPIIMAEAEELIESFRLHAGTPYSVQHKFSLAILNGLWAIVTSRRYSQSDPELLALLLEQKEVFSEAFGNILFSITPEAIVRLAPGLVGLQKVRDNAEQLHSILRVIVKEHQETLDEHVDRDFTDAYLREIGRTTDPRSSFYGEEGLKSLVGTLADLFGTVTELTTPNLEWAVLYLAVYQNVQKKFQAELDSVVGRSRPVALEDRIRLPYTTALMHEILRISSIAPLGVPHVAVQGTQIRGHPIPAGTWIVPNLHYIQNNAKVWGDPEVFRPERFLAKDGRTLLKLEAFMPFCIGKRRCMGENFLWAQFFLFLTNIFQRLTMDMDPQGGAPSFVPDIGDGGLLQPKKYKVIMRDRIQQK